MKLILKKDLPHQQQAIQKIKSVFRDVRINKPIKRIENPIVDLDDPCLYENIERLQKDLPSYMQKVISAEKNYLNIDIKMETGTGKTYVYTRSIYELNKHYGFNKFIIVVPSLPIKAGTRKFIENADNINHFKNVCGYDAEIKLQTIESLQRKKGTKTYIPNTIKDFVRTSHYQRNTIQVLLVNMQHLTESKTGLLVRSDYDSNIEGFSQPIDAISATRPIVIIDEPHRFKKGNSTFKFIESRIKPQVIIRYGATFPERTIGVGRNSVPVKDYENIIYDLNIHRAFYDNLIKGVAKEHVESPVEDEEIYKILSMKKGEYVRFQKRYINEKGKVVKTAKDLKTNDSLSLLSPKLQGISIKGIHASKIILSNGDEKVNGDEFFTDIYATSYIRESIRLALKRHFETEKENFHRKFKIKTLALFFIDDIHSYRYNQKKDPYLKNIFEEELKKKLEYEINECDESELDYKKYLEESLRDIKNTHAGYFSEDNFATDVEIEKEVNTILYDKEKLLSLNSTDKSYNIKRFIFSKWTLREGWDNPNIFTITKLRSSGSEISKLQEVGRGLRLPVDETGNRIENESFRLNYIVDFTEKDFVEKLEKEIYGEFYVNFDKITDDQLEKISTKRKLSKEKVVANLLEKGFITYTLEIKQEKLEDFINEYPEIFNKLDSEKVKDRNKEKDKDKVGIRQENYWKLKELWEKINEKYYLHFNKIKNETLINAISKVITDDLLSRSARKTERSILEYDGEQLSFEVIYDSISIYDTGMINYGVFLKEVSKLTNLPIPIIHEGLSQASREKEIEDSFFTMDTVKSFTLYFKQRIYKELLKIYSYKKLPETSIHPTQLTDKAGNPRKYVHTSAYIGDKKSKEEPLKNYLYDKVLYDSDIEVANIKTNIDFVEVFGKIPKRTLRIPFIDGSTYSPDFMYVFKDGNGEKTLNAVIESKGVEQKQDERGIESDKINSAKKFFKALREDGVDVHYREQTNNEDILDVIESIRNGK